MCKYRQMWSCFEDPVIKKIMMQSKFRTNAWFNIYFFHESICTWVTWVSLSFYACIFCMHVPSWQDTQHNSLTILFWRRHQKVSHIWFISRKIISSTMEVQFDTRWHKENKNALKRKQGKGTHANTITTQGFEDCKNHSLLARRSSNRRKNIGGGNTPSNTGLQSFTIKT